MPRCNAIALHSMSMNHETVASRTAASLSCACHVLARRLGRLCGQYIPACRLKRKPSGAQQSRCTAAFYSLKSQDMELIWTPGS